MPVKGYDFFAMALGVQEEMYCRVCNTKCEVERSAYGPTDFASAMLKASRYHDRFVCPHTGEPWHARALRLVTEMQETPSKTLAVLMSQDLLDLLRRNGIAA